MKSITRVILCLFLAASLSSPVLAEDVSGCMPEPTYTPDMPEYHVREGDSYYTRKQYDLALASYQAALAIEPSSSSAYYGLAIAYRAQGRLDLAIENYGEVMLLSPDYAQPYASRAELYHCMRFYDEAESDLDSYVWLQGQYPAPYLARGDFFMDRQEYARAADDYAAAIERNPSLLEAHAKYGAALLLSGRSGEASDAFARAAALIGEEAPAPADAMEIDLIELIQSPSYGMTEEMHDTVWSFQPDADLVALLYEHGFFDMPEYLETGVLDGDFTWIVVHFKNGETRRVGGLMAKAYGPEAFIALYDAVSRAIGNR